MIQQLDTGLNLTLEGEKLTGTTEGGDLRETARIEFEKVKE